MCLWILEHGHRCTSYADRILPKKNHEKGSLLNFVKCIENKVGFQCKECSHYWTNVLGIIQNLCHLKCPEETLSGRGVEASHRGGRDAAARVFYSGRKTTFSRPSPLQAAGGSVFAPLTTHLPSPRDRPRAGLEAAAVEPQLRPIHAAE